MEVAAPPVSRPIWFRAVGVLVSPRATFSLVVERPRWLDMLALVTIVHTVCLFAFLGSEAGRQALVDQQVTTLESFGIEVTEAVYERLQAASSLARFVRAAAPLVTVPVGTLAIASLLYVVFSLVRGNHATYGQTMAVVVHARAVLLARQLVVTPLNYMRESLSNPTNLAVFLPMLDEGSFLARLLGTIDVFVIWWLAALAIGLGVLYHRRASQVARWVFGLYGGIVLIVAVLITILSVD